MMIDLKTRLESMCLAPILLVASDFDGVLAHIVEHPDDATPLPASLRALEALGTLEQTYAGVISGRSLSDLRARLPNNGDGTHLHLVGSHGAENGFRGPLDDDPAETSERRASILEQIVGHLEEIAQTGSGLRVEVKPYSAALHYRQADDQTAESALRAVREGPALLDGVSTKDGKMVIELFVTQDNKGTAIQELRRRLGAASVIFLGDDVTDEDAFGALGPDDMSIKVGPGATAADIRLPDPERVAEFFQDVLDLRRELMPRLQRDPIESYSMLTDQRSIALVSKRGRVEWMCAPRIDSPAVMANLLDDEPAGMFEITPADASDSAQPTQEYVGDSFLLRTNWDTFSVTDYFDCSAGRAYQRAGRSDLLRVVEGSGRVRVRFAPRLDFGRMRTHLGVRDDGLVVEGSADPIVLRAPGLDWKLIDTGRHHTAVAEFELQPGEPVVLDLRYGTASLRPLPLDEPSRRAQTERFWTLWADSLVLPEIEPALVKRSALVIKGLCYGPSGAISAAATTSLPETAGGERNWDYRYCWLRDGALSAAALVRLGSIGHAMRFLDWMLGIVESADSPERLRPLYTVTGHELGSEAEIGELAGFRRSKPVRVGNGAASQVQLDVFGPVVELVSMLAELGAAVSAEHWRLVEAMVQAVEARWQEPDHGIWEVRTDVQHHVHSKTMCWLTIDRAIALSEQYFNQRPDDWVELRDRIREDVLENAWSEKLGAYSAAYGVDKLDASALALGLTGLVDPNCDRFKSTIGAIEQHLLRRPTVYRYLYDDGLEGEEGGFHLCTSWLIEAYCRVGRHDDARSLFDEMVALAGHTGLLPEEYCPRTGLSLGNHPQAYSHIGLINCAICLSGGTDPQTMGPSARDG